MLDVRLTTFGRHFFSRTLNVKVGPTKVNELPTYVTTTYGSYTPCRRTTIPASGGLTEIVTGPKIGRLGCSAPYDAILDNLLR